MLRGKANFGAKETRTEKMITITTTNEELDTVANNLNHIVKDGGEVVIKNKYGQSKYKKVGNKLIRVW